MGQKLKDHKFNVVSNPFGTIYNPYSIFKNVRLVLSEGLDPENFAQIRGIYYHWDTHSSISGTSQKTFKELLGRRSLESQQSLISSKWMIITLGTIYVYKHSNGKIVANCHKVPQSEFQKIALSSAEIVEDYLSTLEVIRSVNPSMKVILTVSPVRHVRDGLIANNISKATLLKAVHEMVQKDAGTFYFPSYELMIDVLRDYRFYKEDLIHPNDQAVEYIWNRFVESFMDADAAKFIATWSRIRKSLAHRPFHPASPDHQQFLRTTISQLKALSQRVDITTELTELEKQVIK